MKRFEFDANGHHFEFVCTSRNTRNGFAHDASLFIDGNGHASAKATCHYLNRTWENYAFQSVMLSVARGLIDKYIDWARIDWMQENKYERMTAKRKAAFLEWIDFYPSESLKTSIELYTLVNNHGIMSPPYPDWYGHRPKTFTPSNFA